MTHDLGTLTYAEASALAGKRGRFRLTVDSLPDEYAGRTLYDCKSGDTAARTVWLCPGQGVEEGEALTVEGRLRTLYHPAAAGAEGTVFPAFWEYRLVGAVRVG